MDLVVGRYYTGPLGKRYRVVAIEQAPGDMRRAAIQGDGCGVIRFPLEDAAKWLRPEPETQRDGGS